MEKNMQRVQLDSLSDDEFLKCLPLAVTEMTKLSVVEQNELLAFLSKGRKQEEDPRQLRLFD